MGLGDLFKRFTKGASEDEKKAPSAQRSKGGKVMPALPNFLKKDRFIREASESQAAAGTADPDMADAGSFKRPGKWLKERLGGSSDSQAMNNIEKTKTALKKGGGLNDQEIQNFLDGLLDEEKPKTP